MTRTKLLAAALTGLAVFLTALLVYPMPPEPAAYFQPAIQGLLAALTKLGIDAGVRRL